MKALTALFGICSSLLAAPAFGQYLAIYPDREGNTWCFEAREQAIRELYCVVKESHGLTSVRFREPQWANNGVFALNYLPVFPATEFSLTDEVTVSFGECLTGRIHVLTVQVLVMPPFPDCNFLGIEIPSGSDCSGNIVQLGESFGSTQVDTLCHLIAPSSPSPADGATYVDGDAILRWSPIDGPDYCAGVDWYNVYFGTAPDPPLVTTDSYTYYDPRGTLQPNTTYYWRILGFYSEALSISSPLWSFSTGAGPVASRPTTWGRIKSLYR